MRPVKNSEKTLIYDLVDIAIIPASLLICAKAVGIAILNVILGLNWSVQTVTNALFSIRPVYESASDVQLVVSYTNLFMYLAMIGGTMLVAGKSLMFNRKKASPYFVLKLAKYDLLHLLKSSVHIFKEAFVWGVFLIITTIYILISFVQGQTYAWVAFISVLFTLTFLWIMIENIEEEILFHQYK